jgi:hypothetical protein
MINTQTRKSHATLSYNMICLQQQTDTSATGSIVTGAPAHRFRRSDRELRAMPRPMTPPRATVHRAKQSSKAQKKSQKKKKSRVKSPMRCVILVLFGTWPATLSTVPN